MENCNEYFQQIPEVNLAELEQQMVAILRIKSKANTPHSILNHQYKQLKEKYNNLNSKQKLNI